MSIEKVLRDFKAPAVIDYLRYPFQKSPVALVKELYQTQKDLLLTHAYLSLDIEGAEHLVLKAFPWHLHTVHVISIERPDLCSRTYLRKAGFHYLMSLSDQDEVWVHGTLPRFSQVIGNSFFRFFFIRAVGSKAPL